MKNVLKGLGLTRLQIEAGLYWNKTFYVKNDPAHMIDHIIDVYKNAMFIIDKHGFKLDQNIMFYIVFLHDIKCHVSRDEHHTLAYEYVMANKDKYIKLLTQEERVIVGNGVLTHRSSGKIKPKDDYGRVMRVADKGAITIDKLIKRSVKYNRIDVSTTKKELEINLKTSITHLKLKFGANGYAYDDVDWYSFYKDECEILRKEVEAITPEKYLEICGCKKQYEIYTQQ